MSRLLSGLGGTLDRYVLRRMAGIYGVCVVCFVLLYLVVDGFSRLDEFISSAKAIEQQGLSVWSVALRFYATKVPRVFSLVGPYLTLFAGIATLLSFARSNEFVPMLTSGRSAHRVLLPVYAFAITIAGVLVVFEERIVPSAIRENVLLDRLVGKQGKVEIDDIPHLTDGAHRFSAERWFPKDQRLSGLACQRFVDPSGKLPVGILEVEDLRWRINTQTGVVGWYPRGGTLTPTSLGEGGRVLGTVALPPDVPLYFNITPQEIGFKVSSSAEGIPTADLLELRRQEPRNPRWAVDLHTRVTRPVSSFVLLLLGIPFVASPEKRSIAWGLGLALGLCIAHFFVDFGCREIAMRGEINPVVALWTPPVLFTCIALAIMDRMP